MKTFRKLPIHLRSSLLAMITEARQVRQVERHHLSRMRALLNRWPTRHAKGEKRPERPKFVARADAWGDKVSQEVLQEALNDQYEKFWGLQRYRTIELRRKLRTANLAYGFLKGNSYVRIEANGCYMMPDFIKVKELVDQHVHQDEKSNSTIEERWSAWLQEAERALGLSSTDTIITNSGTIGM